MNIPQIMSATDLQMRNSDVLNLLDNGPIVLTQQERVSAVLISIDEWEAQKWKTYDIGLIDDTFTFRREDIYEEK